MEILVKIYFTAIILFVPLGIISCILPDKFKHIIFLIYGILGVSIIFVFCGWAVYILWQWDLS